MKKISKIFLLVTVVSFPIVSFARLRNLRDLVDLLIQYFNIAVYFIISLAVLMFVWNVFKYFIKGGDDVGAKKEAGLYVMWSIVGFFVILSLWGLVRIVVNTFDLDRNAPTNFFGVFRTSSGGNISGGNGGPFGGGDYDGMMNP